jgi:YQGE family putative transporter
VLFFQKRLQKEYQHFKQLSTPGQQLILSIFSYSTIHPIFLIFISAFLWRQTQDMQLVAFYNLAFYSFMPVGFFLNGLLLQTRSLTIYQTYMLGGISKALAVFLLFFSSHVTLFSTILFGALYGICSGLYWSNRNLLTLKLTEPQNRIYFSSLDMMAGTITNIVTPFLAGIFISYGTTASLYTPLQAYYVIAIVLVAISSISILQIKSIKPPEINIQKILLRKPSLHWIQSRGVVATFGILSGTFQFLSVLMILYFVGNEKELGIVQSLSAIIAAGILYVVARKVSPAKRLWIIGCSVLLLIVGGLSFEIFYSALGVFIFMILYSIAHPLLWVAITSLNLDVIDKEVEKHNDYMYVFDHELFLNIGRVAGVIIFLAYSQFVSAEFALRFTPLAFGVLQIGLFILARASHKKHSSYATIAPNESRVSPQTTNTQ